LNAEDQWRRAARAGVHRLTLPTPFGLPVHCYLIDDEPLTLVDTGTNSAEDVACLEEALRGLGRTVEDLERIVVSHQHHDHLGALSMLARRSGAEVCAVDLLAAWMPDYLQNSLDGDEYVQRLLARAGFPAGLRAKLRERARWYYSWADDAVASTALPDGGVLRFSNRELQIHHRPGHSATDTLIVDAERGLTFGADHLIADLAATPLISPPTAASSARPQSLVIYRESMRRTHAMDVGLVLPGHGPPIVDHRKLIEGRLVEQEARAARLHSHLDRPRTVFELTQVIWKGRLTPMNLYLPASEILGHADLLINAGLVRETPPDADGVVRLAST
jgi:glyoxylase-like metal-dependent hydrolase (beta-lactamase superfamily II)